MKTNLSLGYLMRIMPIYFKIGLLSKLPKDTKYFSILINLYYNGFEYRFIGPLI